MLKEEMIQMNSLLTKFTFTDELTDVIENCKGVVVPTSKAELYDMVFGPEHADVYDVVFDVPGKGLVKEADVVRCKNGASVNFTEDYMRRREPDCMRIADDKPTDKKRFADVYGYKFDKLRRETMDWFKTQELILMPFNSGGNQYGYGSMLVCPKQCAFFALFLLTFLGFLLLRFRFLFFLFQVARSRVQRNANRPIPCLHAHLAGHADSFNACPNVQQHQHNHQCQQYNSKQNA